jgi:putative oxidoreductase
MGAERTDGPSRRAIPVRCRTMDSADVDAMNLALLVLRCGLGAVMLAHGINHIFGGGKIAGTARWFESLGMRPGIVHAWLASLTEIAGGALLVLGLLTPLGGAAIVGVMLVAWITNHRGNGFFIFRPGEGWEYVMTLTLAGFAIAVLGAGEWSLDHAFEIFDPPGLDGLLIALIAGGGGAVALLAAAWRPPKPAAD